MLSERLQEVKAWLEKAMQDPQAAEVLLSGSLALREPAIFHCQQSAEKALKAYLVWQNRPFAKTHDLPALLADCTSFDPEFATLNDAAVALTPYATGFRYPGSISSPTPEQSEQALYFARQVLAFVQDRLPREATN